MIKVRTAERENRMEKTEKEIETEQPSRKWTSDETNLS